MSEHSRDDHVISGSPAERAQQIIARHLCGWITGHAGPVEHFLGDAELIMNELSMEGVRFHAVKMTTNSSDGFVYVASNR